MKSQKRTTDLQLRKSKSRITQIEVQTTTLPERRKGSVLFQRFCQRRCTSVAKLIGIQAVRQT